MAVRASLVKAVMWGERHPRGHRPWQVWGSAEEDWEARPSPWSPQTPLAWGHDWPLRSSPDPYGCGWCEALHWVVAEVEVSCKSPEWWNHRSGHSRGTLGPGT